MSNLIKPNDLANALDLIYADLPGLLGENWSGAECTIREHLAAIKDTTRDKNETMNASMELATYLARFPTVRERIQSKLSVVQLKDALGDVIGDQDTDSLAFFRLEAPDEVTRRVDINSDGTSGSSRKVANFRLDVRRLLDLLADTASGTVAALSGHELAKVAGVLSVIRAINKSITVDLTEKEARVFHELVLAHADKAAVSESALLETANQHRRTMGIAEIKLEDLRASLEALEQIHCIARTPEIPDQWSIIESFHVRETEAQS